jgi:hypothetical protein
LKAVLFLAALGAAPLAAAQEMVTAEAGRIAAP